MRRPARLPRALILPLLAAALLRPATARAEQHLRVIDRLGPGELEEATSIYIDDTLLGSVKLDRAHPNAMLQGAVPDAPSHRYRMCGKVITQDASGEIKTHVVDTSGQLGPVDGRVFEATTSDFTLFYLADATPGLMPTRVRSQQGRGCTPVTS